MKSVLFLGNSHVSALKLAHDQMKSDIPAQCMFFCARGADLAFTDVINGHLVARAATPISDHMLDFFFPDGTPRSRERYTIRHQPTGDVGAQFVATGGMSSIDLSSVDAVFYVVGVSPYDFVRLDRSVMLVSRELRRVMLQQMWGKTFALYDQINAIRSFRPACRHYFIGQPLRSEPRIARRPSDRAIIVENRRIVASILGDFLFDDVFMPDEALLDESLLATRSIYTFGGLQESSGYQQNASADPDRRNEGNKSDNQHMNCSYGRAVFDGFVFPTIFGNGMATAGS